MILSCPALASVFVTLPSFCCLTDMDSVCAWVDSQEAGWRGAGPGKCRQLIETVQHQGVQGAGGGRGAQERMGEAGWGHASWAGREHRVLELGWAVVRKPAWGNQCVLTWGGWHDTGVQKWAVPLKEAHQRGVTSSGALEGKALCLSHSHHPHLNLGSPFWSQSLPPPWEPQFVPQLDANSAFW